MSTLFGNNISQTYQGLIKLADSTTGVTATTQSLQDGLGNNIPIQVSNTTVNISGSFLVNGQPVSIETGSFATTGSNTFIGNQTITGSLDVTGTITANSASFNYLETIYETASIIYSSGSNQLGDASDDTQTLWGTIKIPSGPVNITGSVNISGSAQFDLVVTGSAKITTQDALAQLTMSPSSFNVNSTKTISGGAEGYIFGSTGSNAQFYLGVYDEPNFTTDVELNIKVDSNGISFKDWDNVTAGDYIPFMSVAPNLGNNPIPQMLRGLGVTGSIDITGQYLVNGVPVSGDRNGLITTGSIGTSQDISGSLTDFGGNIFIAQSGQTIPFRITGSQEGGNIIMGYNNDRFIPQSQLTGSWSITGSNNIIMNGLIPDENYTSDPGMKAYLSGSNNIIFGQPSTQNGILVQSSSVMLPTMNSNILGGYVNLTFTSSSLAKPTISNNISAGQIYINHPSGSVSMTGNFGNGSISSIANKTTLGVISTITNNLFTNTSTLTHNSSSISYQGNLGTINVTNNYSSSVSNAVNNINVTQNTFGGASNTILVSGSNSGVRRTFGQNIIYGRSNEVNSIYSGSFTGGHLISTAILGQNLIVSASNTNSTIGGSTFVGRYNATGSLQESSQETIFVVGTGFSNGNRRNALRIDSNSNSNFTGSVNISGSLTLNGNTVGDGNRNGLITTGSVGPTQQLTGSLRMSSGSLLLDAGNDDAKIADYFNRNVLYKSEQLGKLLLGQTNMDQIDTQFGVVSGSINLYQFGGNTNSFRTGSNNTWFASSTGLKSGSNNTFIGTSPSFQTGSGNFIIGPFDNTRFSGTEINDVFSIGTSANNSFLFKSGSDPITTVGNSLISGSLNITGTYSINGVPIDFGNRDGLITTGSGVLQSITGALSINNGLSVNNGITLDGSQFKITDQPITFSSSFAIGTANDVAINYTQGVGLGIRNGNIQIGREAGQNFLNTPNTTGNFLFGQYGGQSFESGSGNVFLHTGGSQFISGSDNVFVGRSYGTITGGTNNVILGAYDAPETNLNEYMSLGNTNQSFITKRPSQPIRMSESLTITGSLRVTGDVMFSSGSNTTMGTVALDGGNPGTVTVSNSLVTSNSIIFLTKQTLTNAHMVAVSSKGSGTFTITSNGNGDTDVVAYQIINPA